ncbi:nhl repeat-containing protein 2 [Holotrichia oblita]|uniref:Nhl repeat-containing protein 2 n=1 Tax=Holotrichia oblita TaxID=644536 RepID=A0ACB9SYV5_HOLOL|nr:nhl repeat-containing protein 2 [Holotrichia oblita]
MDEDHILYSHDIISDYIRNSELPRDLAVIEYFKKTNYSPVGDFKRGKCLKYTFNANTVLDYLGLEWFNVSEPLSFSKHLKGKVVVLDFFTYCCINCMHILPDLKEIEKEFSIEDGLVVVGVHSAKFVNERESKNILAAVQRYSIQHPVVNDDTSDMWQKCDVNCWPTLLLLGPNANPLVMLVGEGHKEDLRLYIKNALNYYKSRNEISNHSLPLKSAYHLLPELKGPLLFPGKITNFVDNDGNELIAISDSGNHRVLIITSDGSIIHQIGGSAAGLKDGNLKTAQFNAPQGLVFYTKDILFVADTENHAIRRIDLKNNKVETLIGNGTQGHDRVGGEKGKEQLVSSPWDLSLYRTPSGKDVLIIAMAGTHQIWTYFFEDTEWWKSKQYKAGTCVAIAGSGREENRNNQYPHAAAFAQPSGLALCNKTKEVYIADSESSSIRRLSLIDGKVTAVVGGDRNPNNLFAFGDRDGNLYDAKLQHVLGLAISSDEDYLYVADTYNHKIKKVDISKNSISTLKLTSMDKSALLFNEPAGLCIQDSNTVLVADTNNHCIKILTVDSDNIISIKQLELKLDTTDSPAVDNLKCEIILGKSLDFNTRGGKLIVQIKFNFLKGLKLSYDAPQKWFVNVPNASWSCVPASGASIENIDLVLSIPKLSSSSVSVDFVFNLITCTVDSCYPKTFIIRQPIQITESGVTSFTNQIKVDVQVDKVELTKL